MKNSFLCHGNDAGNDPSARSSTPSLTAPSPPPSPRSTRRDICANHTRRQGERISNAARSRRWARISTPPRQRAARGRPGARRNGRQASPPPPPSPSHPSSHGRPPPADRAGAGESPSSIAGGRTLVLGRRAKDNSRAADTLVQPGITLRQPFSKHPRPAPPRHRQTEKCQPEPTDKSGGCSGRVFGDGRGVLRIQTAQPTGQNLTNLATAPAFPAPAPARTANGAAHMGQVCQPGSGSGSGSDLSPHLPSPSYRRLRECRAAPGRPSTPGHPPLRGPAARCRSRAPAPAPVGLAPALLTPAPAPAPVPASSSPTHRRSGSARLEGAPALSGAAASRCRRRPSVHPAGSGGVLPDFSRVLIPLA